MTSAGYFPKNIFSRKDAKVQRKIYCSMCMASDPVDFVQEPNAGSCCIQLQGLLYFSLRLCAFASLREHSFMGCADNG
jgi:hypothetical protein